MADFNAKTRMLDALKRRPRTRSELCAIGKLSTRTVSTWLSNDLAGKVHVSGYAEDARGRAFVEVFSFGPGENVPRPGQRRTPAERMRALRARRKKENCK